MEYLNYDEVFKDTLRKYDKTPSGWRVLVGKSIDFWDILIIGPEDAWQIKLDTIFKPKPSGLGVKLEEKPKITLPQKFLMIYHTVLGLFH